MEKAITPKTRAIIICNPNNPTGYLYNRKKNSEVLKELVLKHNLYLFSDEAYREFCYDGEHFSAMQLSGVEENVSADGHYLQKIQCMRRTYRGPRYKK